MVRKALTFALLTLALASLAPAAGASRASDKRIARAFARKHHGYRVLGVHHSINAPKGWSAVWWLKKGKTPAKTYASGGAAYYLKNRPVKKPPLGVVRRLHPTALYAVTSTGTGSYSRLTKNDDPDDPVVTSDGDDVHFGWRNIYGTNAKTLAFELDTTGQGFAQNRGSPGISGTGRHTEVATDGTTTCDYTLQEDVGRTEFSTVPLASGKTFTISESLNPPTPHPTDPQNTCGVSPGDPQHPDRGDLATLRSRITFKPPKKLRGPLRSFWTGFTLHPKFQSKRHDVTTDPDSGTHTTTDESLDLSGTWAFQLVGLTATPEN